MTNFRGRFINKFFLSDMRVQHGDDVRKFSVNLVVVKPYNEISNSSLYEFMEKDKDGSSIHNVFREVIYILVILKLKKNLLMKMKKMII